MAALRLSYTKDGISGKMTIATPEKMAKPRVSRMV